MMMYLIKFKEYLNNKSALGDSKMKRFSAVLGLFLCINLFIPDLSHCVPAKPDPFTYVQPGGIEITIYPKGDERVSWFETRDKFTIIKDDDGFYKYAVL